MTPETKYRIVLKFRPKPWEENGKIRIRHFDDKDEAARFLDSHVRNCADLMASSFTEVRSDENGRSRDVARANVVYRY